MHPSRIRAPQRQSIWGGKATIDIHHRHACPCGPSTFPLCAPVSTHQLQLSTFFFLLRHARWVLCCHYCTVYLHSVSTLAFWSLVDEFKLKLPSVVLKIQRLIGLTDCITFAALIHPNNINSPYSGPCCLMDLGPGLGSLASPLRTPPSPAGISHTLRRALARRGYCTVGV